jgi:hypothetical protein
MDNSELSKPAIVGILLGVVIFIVFLVCSTLAYLRWNRGKSVLGIPGRGRLSARRQGDGVRHTTKANSEKAEEVV